MKSILLMICVILCLNTGAQSFHNSPFQPLGSLLPTPGTTRNARGMPGYDYWQQRVNYDIKVRLVPQEHLVEGEEWVTYYNNAPESVSFLWLQLDENQHNNHKNAGYEDGDSIENSKISFPKLEKLFQENDTSDNGLGDMLESVTDKNGIAIPFFINRTMMRLDLERPLATGDSLRLHIKWHLFLTERSRFHGRGGYEYFPNDGNDLYTVAQWYPRFCAMTDWNCNLKLETFFKLLHFV